MKTKYTYMTNGVCCKMICITLDENKNMVDIEFKGGCPGNLNALKTMLLNKPYEEFKGLFASNTCGNKPTSCMKEFDSFLEMIDLDIQGVCEHPIKETV